MVLFYIRVQRDDTSLHNIYVNIKKLFNRSESLRFPQPTYPASGGYPAAYPAVVGHWQCYVLINILGKQNKQLTNLEQTSRHLRAVL